MLRRGEARRGPRHARIPGSRASKPKHAAAASFSSGSGYTEELCDDLYLAFDLSRGRYVLEPLKGRWRCIVLQAVIGQWAGRRMQ